MGSRAGNQFAALGAPLLLEHLGEPVTQRLHGDQGNTAPVTAIVDWSEEIGSNQKDGDGTALPNKRGERIRRTCVVSVPAQLVVNTGDSDFDTFLVPNVTDPALTEEVKVIRITGRDDGLKDVHCVIVEGVSTRGARGRY